MGKEGRESVQIDAFPLRRERERDANVSAPAASFPSKRGQAGERKRISPISALTFQRCLLYRFPLSESFGVDRQWTATTTLVRSSPKGDFGPSLEETFLRCLRPRMRRKENFVRAPKTRKLSFPDGDAALFLLFASIYLPLFTGKFCPPLWKSRKLALQPNPFSR